MMLDRLCIMHDVVLPRIEAEHAGEMLQPSVVLPRGRLRLSRNVLLSTLAINSQMVITEYTSH